jgi:hypothetical protein
VAFGPNDFGIDPESTSCHVMADVGTPFPLCYVSDRRDEVGVCAESCSRWVAPQLGLPGGEAGLLERGGFDGLHAAVELVREGDLDEAEEVLTSEIKRLLVREKAKRQETDGDEEADDDAEIEVDTDADAEDDCDDDSDDEGERRCV